MFGAGIRMREVMEMVKKVLVSLIDDFDGKPADETVQFGWTESATRSTSPPRTPRNCASICSHG